MPLKLLAFIPNAVIVFRVAFPNSRLITDHIYMVLCGVAGGVLYIRLIRRIERLAFLATFVLNLEAIHGPAAIGM
jgi:hypothetical protein